MFDKSLTMRIDKKNAILLYDLAFENKKSKSKVIREALKLLNILNKTEKEMGEVIIYAGEEKIKLMIR